MPSELKPCPFCSGIAERIDIEDGDNAGGSFVHCTVCDASGNIEFEFKENFISNWNRRAEAALSAAEPQPAPSVAVKAIEAVWKYSLVIESSVRRGDGPDQYAGVTEALRLVKEARSALCAQVQDVAGWQPIETAPAKQEG
ncbi:Lar family restriction alleviation protein [Agrobacterium radiobacter]|uniref:Lar family restriction alleviation protein n=1 Tax=Agrobacterium radiobacter TaxID=362 RepID=UPI003F87CCEB